MNYSIASTDKRNIIELQLYIKFLHKHNLTVIKRCRYYMILRDQLNDMAIIPSHSDQTKGLFMQKLNV